MAEVTRRDPDQVARDAARLYEATSDCYALAIEAATALNVGAVNQAADAAELVQAIAGEQLVTALHEAGAVTRPRAEVVAAGWWIQHGRAVRLRPRKKGVQ